MIVFIVLYLIVWIMITALFYKIGSMNVYGMTGTNIFLFVVLQLSALICFLLCVFYSPWNHALQQDVNDTKKKYDKIKEDTESTYQNQIKAFWIDALNQQNRYYLFSFMGLTLLPFFFFFFYMISHSVTEINAFINDSLSFLILTMSVFYTAIVLLVFTITSKKWSSIIIPSSLLLFLAGIFYFQMPLPFYTTLGFLGLCLILSILLLANVAFYWCLIPLVPFYLTLFIMYTQKL